MGLALERGAVIAGRYRLDRLLGRGGMGVVWEATHLVTQRVAALKLLHGPLNTRADMRRRLLREARAASTVLHPNVVEVVDLFELEDGTPVLVMAMLRGETLGKKLGRDAPLSLAETCELMLPVISAVGTAHALGVVHRDLKPENVFLAEQNGVRQVKVLDFGIAKLSIAEEGEGHSLTVTGATLGTPCYMAPEQGFGEPDVDHRADIWSVGAMLYECLTGGRPVEGDNLGQVLKRFMTQGITPIHSLVPDLPPPVADLVTRMLSREPAERPADLREVLAILGTHACAASLAFGPPLPPRASKLADFERAELTRSGFRTLPSANPEREVPLDATEPHSVSVAIVPRSRRKVAVVSAIATACLFAAVFALRVRSGERTSVPASGAGEVASARPSLAVQMSLSPSLPREPAEGIATSSSSALPAAPALPLPARRNLVGHVGARHVAALADGAATLAGRAPAEPREPTRTTQNDPPPRAPQKPQGLYEDPPF